MERLTFEGNFCAFAQCSEVPGGSFCENGACSQKKVWERLKAYEDTSLSPEDCAEYKKFEDEIIASGKTFGRLIELLDADKDGRVVVLPCKVGDMVYRTWSVPEHAPFVEEVRMSSVAAIISLLRKFGKTVFLTRKEAEKALQEMQRKEDANE